MAELISAGLLTPVGSCHGDDLNRNCAMSFQAFSHFTRCCPGRHDIIDDKDFGWEKLVAHRESASQVRFSLPWLQASLSLGVSKASDDVIAHRNAGLF